MVCAGATDRSLAPLVTVNADAVAVLAAVYAARSPVDEPLGRATAAYRLAVAVGESAPADHRRALRLLDEARSVLTETRAPIEHARILTAAASQHRAMSEPVRAAELFERAAWLLDARADVAERAAAWSNVGLARSELGRLTEAVDAFDRAADGIGVAAVTAASASSIGRIHATVLINRGLALFSLGDFDRARADLEAGLGLVDVAAAPVQLGMAHHSLGQLFTAEGRTDVAIPHFLAALRIFTRTTFPYQHAVATFNLGVAYARDTVLISLQRALWSFEAAVNLFDPRMQTPQWQETATRLNEVTHRLAKLSPGRNVAEHRASLLGSVGDDEQLSLMRDLAERFAARPDPQRTASFFEAAAAARGEVLGVARALLRTTLFVLAELPDPVLRSGLIGQLGAHRNLAEHDRMAADTALDQVIQELFQGPQRVRFRDILYELGWERP